MSVQRDGPFHLEQKHLGIVEKCVDKIMQGPLGEFSKTWNSLILKIYRCLTEEHEDLQKWPMKDLTIAIHNSVRDAFYRRPIRGPRPIMNAPFRVWWSYHQDTQIRPEAERMRRAGDSRELGLLIVEAAECMWRNLADDEKKHWTLLAHFSPPQKPFWELVAEYVSSASHWSSALIQMT
ncbi:hypothetical protein K474DRAFT_1714291 [Panus rudis PR-1116 ss-1]|nr:hypothetical protein K474DRAFT_1714291 [Panus rudis PR-1116 ss-1]